MIIRVALTASCLLSALIALVIVTAIVAIGPGTSPDSALAALPGQVADIPPEYLALYARAGNKYTIDWAVLAAIGKIETNHGRSTQPGVQSGVNFAGCCAGPMQFNVTGNPSTWHSYGRDDNHDGRSNVYDPADAIPAAARYLRASGAPGDYRRAVFAYNHANWYVDKVLAQADQYRALATTPTSNIDTLTVVANSRILLSPTQRRDLVTGQIDQRVVAMLAWIAQRHTIIVTALRSDHSELTIGGSVSNHALGRAVDIGSVDSTPCTGTRTGACGQLAVEIAQLTGPIHVTELIYCFDLDGATSADAFADAHHCDHVHAGFDGAVT